MTTAEKKERMPKGMVHPLGEIDKAWKECLDLITTERREMIPGRESWDQYAGRLRSLAVCAEHYAEAIMEYLQEKEK